MEGYYRNAVVDDRVCILGIDELLPRADHEFVTHEQEEVEIQGADGFLLIYSKTSSESLNRVRRYYSDIFSVKADGLDENSAKDQDTPSIPMILVANKSDAVDNYEVTRAEGLMMAKDLGCMYVETSAKNDTNVIEAFQHIVRIIRRERHRPPDGSLDGGPP